MKLLIIFNPQAAFGRSRKKLAAIQGKFEELGIQVSLLPTAHAGHGKALVASHDLSAYDGLIAAGGDGTLFEVLNGLYEHPKDSRIPLGLLPIGTGNAFARDLGLQPGGWGEAIELLRRGRTRKVDVGRVETADSHYHFLNIVGMGFTVDASKTAQKLKFLGNSAYTLATLWQVLKLKSYPLVMDLDGQELCSTSIFITLSNTRYTGTHFQIAPDAIIDDGLLDITLLESLPRSRLLRLFPTIYDGRHVEHKEIITRRASQIDIHSPEAMLLAPDGELLGHSPARIRCLHQDLSIFY